MRKSLLAATCPVSINSFTTSHTFSTSSTGVPASENTSIVYSSVLVSRLFRSSSWHRLISASRLSRWSRLFSTSDTFADRILISRIRFSFSSIRFRLISATCWSTNVCTTEGIRSWRTVKIAFVSVCGICFTASMIASNLASGREPSCELARNFFISSSKETNIPVFSSISVW